MNTPHDDRGRMVQEVREFHKFAALCIGSILLAVIVLLLVLFAHISRTAAIGYWVLAVCSLGVAFFLMLTWAPFYSDMAGRAGSPDAAEELLRWLRGKGKVIILRRPLRRLSRVRFDRSTLGLWIPFIISLVAVGWLIYFSGGIVHSPFATVPVIMFTLVVLLIDVPTGIRDSIERNRDNSSSETPQLDISAMLIFPFKILIGVAIVFFVSMIALSIDPWPLEREPTDSAALTMTLSTAVVGITYAAMARFDILRRDMDSPSASDEDEGKAEPTPADQDNV